MSIKSRDDKVNPPYEFPRLSISSPLSGTVQSPDLAIRTFFLGPGKAESGSKRDGAARKNFSRKNIFIDITL
jgi:hypothetical protein